MAFPADPSSLAAASGLFAAAVAGFVGSPHCAAMCGPLVIGCTRDATDATGVASAIAAQQAGRFGVYVLLGALAGGLGSRVDGLTAARTDFHFLPAIVGGLLVLVGLLELFQLGERGFVARALSPGRRLLSSLLKAGQRIVRGTPARLRPVALGILSGLLPCGLLHAMVLAATGTGSSGAGASLLVAFFLGTLPALIAVAIGSSVLARPAPRMAHFLKAAALVSAGVALLYFRADPPCCSHGS